MWVLISTVPNNFTIVGKVNTKDLHEDTHVMAVNNTDPYDIIINHLKEIDEEQYSVIATFESSGLTFPSELKKTVKNINLDEIVVAATELIDNAIRFLLDGEDLKIIRIECTDVDDELLALKVASSGEGIEPKKFPLLLKVQRENQIKQRNIYSQNAIGAKKALSIAEQYMILSRTPEDRKNNRHHVLLDTYIDNIVNIEPKTYDGWGGQEDTNTEITIHFPKSYLMNFLRSHTGMDHITTEENLELACRYLKEELELTYTMLLEERKDIHLHFHSSFGFGNEKQKFSSELVSQFPKMSLIKEFPKCLETHSDSKIDIWAGHFIPHTKNLFVWHMNPTQSGLFVFVDGRLIIRNDLEFYGRDPHNSMNGCVVIVSYWSGDNTPILRLRTDKKGFSWLDEGAQELKKTILNFQPRMFSKIRMEATEQELKKELLGELLRRYPAKNWIITPEYEIGGTYVDFHIAHKKDPKKVILIEAKRKISSNRDFLQIKDYDEVMSKKRTTPCELILVASGHKPIVKQKAAEHSRLKLKTWRNFGVSTKRHEHESLNKETKRILLDYLEIKDKYENKE